MKKIELFIITMLFVISYAYADGYRTDEDHWEKVRQMDEMAERFKAETGFTGSISYDLNMMCIGYYEGKFADIQITAEADTASFRSAFEQILDKVLPYTFAKRDQLVRSRITNIHGIIETVYYQQVNGYRVEGIGRLSIAYEVGRNAFAIGNGTVELPEGDVRVIITEEQAFQIARSEFEKTDLCNENTPPWRHKSQIQFKSRQIGDIRLPYRLCWRIVFPGRLYYIDAETGEWFAEGYVINQQITCEVLGNKFSKDSSFNSLGHQAMRNLEILNGEIDPYYTNESGIAILTDYPSGWFQVNYQSDKYSVRAMSSPSCLSYSKFTQTSTGINVVLPDSLYCSTDSIYYAQHAPNILHHMNEQDSAFCSMVENFSDTGYPQIVTDCDIPGLGHWDPQLGEIQIREGRNSHVLRHEASHYFTYRVMGNHQFFETTNPDTTDLDFAKPYQAMDEAFAEYWLSVGINSTHHNYGNAFDIAGYDVSSIHQEYYGESLALNESFYTQYWNRYPLASAWWSLRDNSLFPDNDQGVCGVDTLLVNSLRRVSREIPQNNAYRYKPRYFYNILMSRVDTDNKSWPFNPKQAVIDSEYSVRGFHFYPKVQSVASADVTTPLGRESYNVLDSVYVHISNYPQNTYVQVFVVEDRDYLNVGDNGIAIPAPYEVDGNPVSGIFKTDGNGKWAGGIPFSRLLPQGDYDIIVNNMVNPTAPNNNPTDPDNTLHLAFKNDYIIDGVDGLDGPGFTKTGTGDIVVALDFSSSMSGYGAQLAQMVKALEQSMIDSERINVFGFTEGTASQGWIEDGITGLIGDDSSFLEVTQIESTNITCDNNLLIWRKNI